MGKSDKLLQWNLLTSALAFFVHCDRLCDARYVWLSKGQIEHLMGLGATKASMDALGPLPRWQACQELDRSSTASGVTQNPDNPCTHHTPELAP